MVQRHPTYDSIVFASVKLQKVIVPDKLISAPKVPSTQQFVRILDIAPILLQSTDMGIAGQFKPGRRRQYP